MEQSPAIFCAIDTTDLDHARMLAKTVGPVTKGLKLGLEFFNAFGPAGIGEIQNSCPEAALFIDLKYHDIPNTVAAAVKALSRRIKPAYLNVHAAGGLDMMKAAKDACHPDTKLLAVTVLTSLSQDDLQHTNITGDIQHHVKALAQLAKDSGLDGVVCSAHEIATLRSLVGQDLVFMVPGIRPEGASKDDQKRTITPQEAINQGATHLVIGRPITGSPAPAAAARAILSTLG
ncbi:MAG: orotidine-5'-phosphate decarboxylase [Alphaproteobacteria bacterium]